MIHAIRYMRGDALDYSNYCMHGYTVYDRVRIATVHHDSMLILH